MRSNRGVFLKIPNPCSERPGIFFYTVKTSVILSLLQPVVKDKMAPTGRKGKEDVYLLLRESLFPKHIKYRVDSGKFFKYDRGVFFHWDSTQNGAALEGKGLMVFN